MLVEKLPGVIETDEAFVILQERVEETPGCTAEGEAEKEEIVGARPLGVTLPDADEEADVPTILVAVTTKVYPWPFVREDTMIGLTVDVADMLPGFEVAL